jgi:voltage-gated potassium channel
VLESVGCSQRGGGQRGSGAAGQRGSGRGVNPKVKTPADALLYITTCMSVGYADVFAKSTAGKLIASYVMTVGPSMTAKLFDAPAAEEARREGEQRDFQKALLAKLDVLTEQLRARP